MGRRGKKLAGVLFGVVALGPLGGCGPTTQIPTERPSPSPTDTDGDQVPDDTDRCLEAREDVDGFDDTDGCPDVDNDNDGILDVEDQCPDEAEIINGVDDDDGCPDTPSLVPVYGSPTVEIREQIYFDSGSSTLKSLARPTLKDIARVLEDNPGFDVRLEGHTDAREASGEDARLALSESRAENVRGYLVAAGIAPARLEIVARGDAWPIDTNQTEDGRARNRRVDFVLLDN